MHKIHSIAAAGTALLSLAAALLVGGCSAGGDKSKDQAKDKDQAIPVEVAPIVLGPIEATLTSSTHLEAEEEVKVLARTANRVTELLVEEGDAVVKDQILARLDHDIQSTSLSKAEVRLDKARREFDRQKALFEQKLVSEQVFTDSQLELKQLQLAVDDARRELAYTEVRAPISGTVSRRLVKQGDLVNLNQHLFDLVDLDSTVARVYLPEKHLAELELGQVARVTADSLGKQEFTGYIRRIAPVIESKSGTVKVTIGFKNRGALRPGMFVDVEIVLTQVRDALLISKRALVYDGELTYVFRMAPGGRVARIPVEPRIADRLHVQPVSGFTVGDQIVVAGQTGLKDGSRVRLPETKAPSTAHDQQKPTQPAPTTNGKPS